MLQTLLSPIIGIMIVDYFLLRGRELDVEALFQHPGPYSATRGVSVSAIVALLLGNLIALPGFLMSVDLTNSGVVPPELGDVYPYTPLIGLAVGGVVYFVGRQLGRLIGGSTDHAPPVTDSASLSD